MVTRGCEIAFIVVKRRRCTQAMSDRPDQVRLAVFSFAGMVFESEGCARCKVHAMPCSKDMVVTGIFGFGQSLDCLGAICLQAVPTWIGEVLNVTGAR